MPDQLRRIARKVRATIPTARQGPVHGSFRIEKQSAHHGEVAQFLESLTRITRAAPLAELGPVMDRQHALRDALTGQVHETSFRHKMQKMDAGEVLAAVSSPSVGLDLIYLAAQAAPDGWRAELGSAFGIGTVALALAEKDTNNPVDGIEYEAWRADIATEGARHILADRVTVHAGPIEEVLPRLARERPPLAFAFVDAMHTHEATVGYHRLIERYAAAGAMILYDDLGWSSQMELAWKDIVASPSVTDAARIDHRWGLARYTGKA